MGNKIDSSNIEKEPERTLLQKQNDRLALIFFTGAIIFLIIICIIYQSAELPTADTLRERIAAKGYEGFDITEQYADYEYILNVFCIDSNSLYIEFCEVDSENTAAYLYDANDSFLKSEYNISSENSLGTDRSQRNYLANSETFYAIACYENTFIYAYTDINNKSDQRVIKDIIAATIPPSLTLILVFFGTGSLCLFLGFGFVSQEQSKRKRCDVSAVATVIGNKKERTTDMPEDRNKKHYGASVAYSYCPTVSYYANNELFQETYGNGFAKPIKVGTKIEILYNSKDPEEFCFANEKLERQFIIIAFITFMAGLVLCGISVNMLLKLF